MSALTREYQEYTKRLLLNDLCVSMRDNDVNAIVYAEKHNGDYVMFSYNRLNGCYDMTSNLIVYCHDGLDMNDVHIYMESFSEIAEFSILE